jgi:hypothetical protein
MIKESIILQIILGFLFADLITGAFHWFEDCYLDYCIDLPIIGEIAKDNELHHYFPRSMLAYSYTDNIKTTLPAIIIFLIILYLTNKTVLFEYQYFFITFSFFCIFSNVIHRFSHMRKCEKNSLLKILHKTGILCSSEQHKEHHHLSNEKYCVITEFNNYYLDKINFWRGLEHGIYLFTGVKPNRKGKYSDYEKIHNHMHENGKLECPINPTMKDVEELKNKLQSFKECKLK